MPKPKGRHRQTLHFCCKTQRKGGFLQRLGRSNGMGGCGSGANDSTSFTGAAHAGGELSYGRACCLLSLFFCLEATSLQGTARTMTPSPLSCMVRKMAPSTCLGPDWNRKQIVDVIQRLPHFCNLFCQLGASGFSDHGRTTATVFPTSADLSACREKICIRSSGARGRKS